MKTIYLSILGAFFLIAAQLNAAVIAQWGFENDLNDSSGNGLNLSGGAGYSYSASVPGSVINPGGISDTASYVPGPKTTPIGLAANTAMTNAFSYGSFTLQAFVYLTGGGDFQTILWNEDGPTGSYFSVGTSTCYLDGYNGNGALASASIGTGLTTDVWHHVAWVGTYTANNGTAVQFYKDGVAEGAATFFAANSGGSGAHIAPSTANWQVAAVANQFTGMIDQLQVNDTALTPAQFNVAVPEPGTSAMLLMAGVCGILGARVRPRAN